MKNFVMFSWETALNGSHRQFKIFSFGYGISTIRAGREKTNLFMHISSTFLGASLFIRFNCTFCWFIFCLHFCTSLSSVRSPFSTRRNSALTTQRRMRCILRSLFLTLLFNSLLLNQNFPRFSSGICTHTYTHTHLDINMWKLFTISILCAHC